MKRLVKNVVQNLLTKFGYRIIRSNNSDYGVPVEFEQRDIEIFRYVLSKKLTMVSLRQLIATIQACKYVVRNDIAGDFAECGVWRGGNALAAKFIFEAYGSKRGVILFDTFAGMTEPTDWDKTRYDNKSAKEKFLERQKDNHNEWCYASLEEVEQNFKDAKVDLKDVKFVQGDVLKTLSICENLPHKIAVLRLDIDWYESTRKEMEVLYPLLSRGGVLLIDDYGHWDGARKAIEEYFYDNSDYHKPLLQYTDYAGRMGVKP